MGWVEGAIWGMSGGFASAAIDYINSVRRYGRMPWEKRRDTDPGPTAHVIAAVLQLAVGAILASAAARTVSDLSPWLALTLGAAAPTVLSRLTSLVPLVLHTMVQQSLLDVEGAGSPLAASNGHRPVEADVPAQTENRPLPLPTSATPFEGPPAAGEGGG